MRQPPDAGIMTDLLWSDPQVGLVLFAICEGALMYRSSTVAHRRSVALAYNLDRTSLEHSCRRTIWNMLCGEWRVIHLL